MPIIGSDASLSQAAFFANLSAAQHHASIRKLASGSRLSDPSSDAAGLAVSSRLEALSKALSSASQSSQNLVSFSQTADGFLNVAGQQLTRLSELAIRAQDGSLSSSDRANLNVEFVKIRDSLSNQISNASFNGTNVFDTNQTVQASVDGSGTNFFSLAIADAANDIAGIANTDITTAANAQAALGQVNTALDNITSSRAKVNADIEALNFADQSSQTQAINTETANSRIRDTEFARESVELARAGIQNQASIAVLSHANFNRQNILGLLK